MLSRPQAALRRPLFSLTALAVATLVSHGAQAAEITEVVDAFDEANDNPFDFHIEPSIRQSYDRGVIARETGCDDCDEPATVFRRDLDYRRVQTIMDFDFQIGLNRDLELHIGLPLVLSDRRTLEYADGVSPANSAVDPSDQRIADDLDPSIRDYYDGPDTGDARRQFGTYRYFDVPDDGVRRSGLGDMTVGLAWAPFNNDVNPHVATLRFNLDYVAPTGKPARGNNTGVGRGVHELQVGLSASRRYVEYVEPYFAFSYAHPFAAKNGLFAANSPNSETQAPGGRMDFNFGTEILLFEDLESDQVYSWDLGVNFGYNFPGRDYTPLSDALARSECNGLSAGDVGYVGSGGGTGGTNGNAYNPAATLDPDMAACGWVAQRPGNVLDDTSADRALWTYAHDGISDVDGYARMGAHTRFNLQFSRYIELRLGVQMEFQTPHLLNTADSGRDTGGDDIVDLDPDPADGDIERNPFYDLSMDPVGRRFRIEGAFNIGWDAVLAFQF